MDVQQAYRDRTRMGAKLGEHTGEEQRRSAHQKPTRARVRFQMSLSSEPDHPARMQTPPAAQCAAVFACNLSSSTCGIVLLERMELPSGAAAERLVAAGLAGRGRRCQSQEAGLILGRRWARDAVR